MEYKGFPIISGKNLINASVMYAGMPFSVIADAAYAIDDEEDYDFDLYTGITMSYMINYSWTASVWAVYTNDFDNDKNYWLAISPTVSYAINQNNTIGVGVYFDFTATQKNIAFPISWTYRF